jgi:D-amino-acid oxidase
MICIPAQIVQSLRSRGMDALFTSVDASEPSRLKGRQILVVGAGVVGLSTAIRLRLSGANVEVVTSPNHPMVSPMACALFLPTWLGADNLFVWSGWLEPAVVKSWHRYQLLLDEFGADAGIRSVTNHEYLRVGDPNPPRWVRSLLAPSELAACNLNFASRQYDRVWKFRTVVIDMSRYMPWLELSARLLGISIQKRQLESFDDAFDFLTRVVVNCSGLGARRLVPDEAVRPVRGQVLFLQPADATHLTDFVAIGLGEYCLIPRITDVGLGSLFEQEADRNETQARHSLRDEKKLWAALDTLLGLSGVDPSELEFSGRTSVGLRPIREGGCRLEALWNGDKLIVHNYGHGGAGVTLAWGCADRVVELISKEFGVGDSEDAASSLPGRTRDASSKAFPAAPIGRQSQLRPRPRRPSSLES